MVSKLARLVISGISAFLGFQAVLILHNLLIADPQATTVGLHYLILGPFLFGIVGWFLAPAVLAGTRFVADQVVGMLQRIPTPEIVTGACGLVVGMMIGALATFSLPRSLPFIGTVLPFIVTVFMGYIGALVAVRKSEDLAALFSRTSKATREEGESKTTPRGVERKLLDTSVIIDGRILDICETGFIEGELLVPVFVLEELQHIADSADQLRRNRGRRGLDVLSQMQKLPHVKVEVVPIDFDDVSEVDTKLIRAALELEAKILTNDYNLNKVAALQGVTVLNINELANAVKPIMLPGEEMDVQVIKEGKELGQGVGYLEDGTMIVIENGKRFIGQTITVVVTSVLQTSAGRMIFGKPREQENRVEALR